MQLAHIPAPHPPESTRLVETVDSLVTVLGVARARGGVVGLVPTMGALHTGHASLITRAVAECSTVVVSVFVNPIQFDDPTDLSTYPRDIQGDLALAASAGAEVVFAPPVGEIWPRPPATKVSVAELAGRYEGLARPGHLDGVATVVARLMAVVGPDRAYFGEKDYQQLLVVRRVVADLGLGGGGRGCEVVACPTVRESDGLAVSSRNGRLDGPGRRAATVLVSAIEQARAQAQAGLADGESIRRAMEAVFEAETAAALDYADVVDGETLKPLSGPIAAPGQAWLLVAATVGGVRLIDSAPLIGRAPLIAPARDGLR